MKPDNMAASSRRVAQRRERCFTPQSANAALVLVRRIVQDIVDHYHSLSDLRAERDALLAAERDDPRVAALRERVDAVADRLRELNEELVDIGCDLKDWNTGLIDFPAKHEGKKVLLCWRLGEEAVEYWHEPQAGFSGRQKIPANFAE